MRRISLVLIAVVAVALFAGTANAQTPEFKLGFKGLAEQIPNVVGVPLENEHFEVATGNSLQQTSKGLMVWRKIDNFTCFTDGTTSWIAGPLGLQSRLNTERFDWEKDPVVSAPQPAQSAEAPRALRLLDQGYGVDVRSGAWAFIIENPNPSFAIEDTPLRVIAYDSANVVLAAYDGIIDMVLPGQKRGISGPLYLPSGSRMARMDVRLESGRFITSIVQTTFSVDGVTFRPDRYFPTATGVVRNPYNSEVTNLRVAAVAYDAQSKIIGGGSTWLKLLPPKGQALVEVSITATGTVAKIELYPMVLKGLQ